MQSPIILKGAEPYSYPGGKIGCLVVHGFTGTPGEVRWVGQALAEAGCTVYGIRLAGHGTTVKDMNRVTWREWYLDVLAGYHVIRNLCDTVLLYGMSMGGALTMALTSRHPVDGVVGLSAMYQLPLKPPSFSDAARLAFIEQLKAEQTRRGEEPIGHPTYQGNPLPAVIQLYQLLRFSRSQLHEISAPTLLIHSKTDDVIPYRQMEMYYNAIGSTDKQTLSLERSTHLIGEDVEREIVFASCVDFARRVGGL